MDVFTLGHSKHAAATAVDSLQEEKKWKRADKDSKQLFFC